MRKFSFFLVSLLCLCASTAWGIDWVNDVTPENGASFYLCSNQTKNFLAANNNSMVSAIYATIWTWETSNYTLTSNSYYLFFNKDNRSTSNNTYGGDMDILFVDNSSYYSIRLNHTSDKTNLLGKKTGDYYYWFFNESNTTYSSERNEANSNSKSQWLLISSIQYNNHIAMDKYIAARTAIAALDANDFPSGFLNTVPTASANVSRYQVYGSWMPTDDETTTINGHTTILNAWLSYAEVVKKAYAAGYTGNPASVASATTTAAIETAKNNYRADAAAYLMSTYTVNLPSLTFLIDNPEFENTPWYYGWNGTVESYDESDATKDDIYVRHTGDGDNGDNKYPSGTTFAEMWVDDNGNNNVTLAAADIFQTITLPAGVYKLSADVASSNITSKLYISYNDDDDAVEEFVECTNSARATQSMTFILASQKNVRIGYKHDGLSDKKEKWVAIDNIQLTLKNRISNGGFSDSPWDNGWTTSDGSDESHTYKRQSYTDSGFDGNFAQMWKDGNKLDADGDIYQYVYLPAGYYKLKATVASGNIESTLYATVGNTEYNDWFNSNGSVGIRALCFYVPSASNVCIGYKTRNHSSSSEASTWTAVDDITLTTAAKLDLVISETSGMNDGVLFVGDVITPCFAISYSNDSHYIVPTPTTSSSDNFYYTITQVLSGATTEGCPAGHNTQVITYNPSTKTIEAWNEGTATIKFWHKGTSVVNELSEQTFVITVNKNANPITVTLDGAKRNSKNIGFDTDVTLAYSSPSDVAYSVTHRTGSSSAVTLSDGTLSSAEDEGVDYWDITQAENYKYEAGSAFVRIQVNKEPETESYLYTAFTDGSNYNVNSGNYEITLNYSPLEVRYRAKRDWGNSANVYCTWYDANGTQLGQKKEDLVSDFSDFTRELPANTRKIVFSKSGTGDKIIDRIYVVRRTYIDVSATSTNLGTVYVGNTATTTLNIEWGTSNGGDISVESSNSRFAVSTASVATSANSNGSTSLTITYTPDNENLGTEVANISVKDTYHFEQITISATAALKTKTLVNGYGMMYNSSKNIQIDDNGTDVYDATYNSSTHVVTLNKREASNSDPIIIPANNVVMLYKASASEDDESTIYYEYTTESTNISISANNCFMHHDDAASDDHTDYVLAKVNGEVAFYRYDASCDALDNYNVLQLPVPHTSAPSMIRLDWDENNTTALMHIFKDGGMKKVDNMQIYNIMGIPVSDMSRPGIYIQNGKKYIVY